MFNQTLASWSAFFPSPAVDITTSVPVAANDTITVSVSTTETSGTVTVENKTQNKKFTQAVSAPNSADPARLTALTADWWVQAYQVIPGELVQTPKYGLVAFTDCTAVTKSGIIVPLNGAGVFDISGTSGQQYSKTNVTATGVNVNQCKNLDGFCT